MHCVAINTTSQLTFPFLDSLVSVVSEELILINQGEKTQEVLVKEFGKTRVGFCKQVTFNVIKIPMLLMIILAPMLIFSLFIVHLGRDRRGRLASYLGCC